MVVHLKMSMIDTLQIYIKKKPNSGRFRNGEGAQQVASLQEK
jgi:hypothetical protein